MRFTYVEEVPNKRTYNNLKDELERFVQSGLKVARVDFQEGEYKDGHSAANCLRSAIKRHLYNGIKVFERGGNVYLENDM